MRGQVANFVFRPVGVQMQNRNLPCPEAALGGSHLQGPPPCSEVTEGTEEALFQCSWLTEEASSHQCHEQCPVDREAKPKVHAVHGAYLHHPAREPLHQDQRRRGAALIQHCRQEIQSCDLRPSRVEVPKGMIVLKHCCLAMVAHAIPSEAWLKPQDLAQKGPVPLDLSQSEHSPRHSNTIPSCIESTNDIGQQWPEREASSNEARPEAEDHIVTHTHFLRLEECEGQVHGSDAITLSVHLHVVTIERNWDMCICCWMLLIVLPLPAPVLCSHITWAGQAHIINQVCQDLAGIQNWHCNIFQCTRHSKLLCLHIVCFLSCCSTMHGS